jgi:hypothetical protein
MSKLVQLARDERTSEADLVREGVERVLHSRLAGPGIPRFARRLGPLALPENQTSPEHLEDSDRPTPALGIVGT